MSQTQLRFDASALGRWSEEDTFEVTRERIVEYARATNDPISEHLAGDVAPPVFAVVPAFSSMTPAALSVAPAELTMKLVHGEQDFRFHRPIKPGDRLVASAMPAGYEGKPNGTRADFYLRTHTGGGELVNEQWMTAFFRGFDAGETVGERAPGHAFDESLRTVAPLATVVQHVDEDQTFRYAPAAGDPMPIHLDEDIARSSGLPGIIAHGLCTMAFTSWAVLTEVGAASSRLRRLAVRFAKPVLPGQDITTRIWRAGTTGSVTSYAYETTVDDTVVVKDGLAEIAEA